MKMTHTHHGKSVHRRRKGIVLLIVLGMLSLFTVLVVSFVVFSSQVVQSSMASQERRIDELLPAPPIEAAVMQLISGTNDPNSAAFRNSFLEDIYGNDGLEMRVAHFRTGGTSPGPVPPTEVGRVPGGQLLLPRTGTQPQTTLFRFATNAVQWHADGTNPPTGTTIPQLASLPPGNPLRLHLDDIFAGRIITFDEGPLKNKSFRVVRWFGNSNGYDSSLTTALRDDAEYGLAGNIVIDLSELGQDTILIDGVQEDLYDIAENFPERLLYSPGPDGATGTGALPRLGAPGSDDVGFRFVLNGAAFNGLGSNPSGDSGVIRNPNPGTAPTYAMSEEADRNAQVEFTLNSRLTGASFWGGRDQGPGNFQYSPVQADEAWDAADWENLFLAWQPSDHRRAILTNANSIYQGIDGARLNRLMGQHIIPSFHRPSIINYLMNAPIFLPTDSADPTDTSGSYTERTYSQIRSDALSGSSQPQDPERLKALVTRIRRAVVRPLNFPHDYVSEFDSDLNRDGNPFDGAPEFSGSNPVAILNQSIDVNAPIAEIVLQIDQLALWLINGPWDIDNDGDGIPDSVWVDFNLPTVVGPNGQILKPMIAPLIEDLDGRINVNYSGSYDQLVHQRFQTGPSIATDATTGESIYNNAPEYNSTNLALKSYGFGGGVGPAEIDFTHLFQFESVPPSGYIGPVSTTQTANGRDLDSVLLTRYGNLLNARYGGAVYNYAASYPYDPSIRNHAIPASPVQPFPQNIYPFNLPYGAPASLSAGQRAFSFLRYPGAGSRLYPGEQSDQLAGIPFPSRSFDVTTGPHQATNPFAGRPMDLAGVRKESKNQYGQHSFGAAYRSSDYVNDPYEFGATEVIGDDTPFTPAEYVDFLKGGALGGRLSQLLSDAAERNEALSRLITTESRSVDSPDLPGQLSMIHFFAQRFADYGSAPPSSLQTTILNRMLAVEFRKGSKLNLNRQLGNVADDNLNNFGDETNETRSGLLSRAAATPPFEANTANNRRAPEAAFPVIGNTFTAAQQNAAAHYGPTEMYAAPGGTANSPDFNGLDLNGDGDMADLPAEGTDFDGDGEAEAIATGSELLARHLYCLMYVLISGDAVAGGELCPNFPYPTEFAAATTGQPIIRNRYVARQIAQWAANAVDYRDVDAKFTRLRYDPNPFDSNGFNLATAAANEVWGMEKAELQITETFAMHDKRLKRNLPKEITATGPNRTADGEMDRDDDTDPGMIASDSDMDQFRIPQGTAIVELQALAAPRTTGSTNGVDGENQTTLPPELYTPNGRLHLSRAVGAPTDATFSPVWRLAVGERHNGDHQKSTRWIFDADRLADLSDETGTTQDVADYLDDTLDWTGGSTTLGAELDDWRQTWRFGADVRHSRRIRPPSANADPANREYVTLSDDDFDPSTDVGGANPNNTRIELQRFVWFTDVAPTATMNIITHPDSGMRLDNIYFNKANAGSPAMSAPAELAPGQFAVVAPRVTTFFGQKTTSARDSGPGVAPGPNSFPYSPSDQFLEFAPDTTEFRLNYRVTGSPDSQTPYYASDPAAEYHVNPLVPIICQSLYPNEVPGFTPGAAFDWSSHAGLPVAERVDMGFNISEPLPGPTYYQVPEFRIQTAGTPYPKRDGYRDYPNSTGFHPDTPLDHLASAPLAQNNFEWAAVGTHQEAASIFLQRLADPTMPWHPTNNPYITVDFMPMDLTTINGEEDVRELIDRQANDGTTIANVLVDNRSIWSTPGGGGSSGFTPEVRLDSRRKIPDLTKDRGFTALLAGGSTRQVCAQRSPLSMTTSVMRESTPTRPTPVATPLASEDHWAFELGSMWNNGTATVTLNTGYITPVPAGNPTSTPYENTHQTTIVRFDDKNLDLTQTLGFVNREYGNPVASNSPSVGTFGIGNPENVFLLTVPWMNREFRSPMDLMNVPAVSQTRLLATFNPLTIVENGALGGAFRELPTDVWETARLAGATPPALRITDTHLLGFDKGTANRRTGDYDGQFGAGNRQRLGMAEDYTADFDDLTGGRAGFEQIFDYVDVGPVWFDSQHWFDPARIQFRNDASFDSGNADVIRQNRMFNRAVDTLQPPNNYIGRHRTPGKINLNTTPDYIRKGPRFPAAGIPGGASNFLDGAVVNVGGTPTPVLEDPEDPGSLPNQAALISANPRNNAVRGDGFSNEFVGSRLFGNGSVYRSLTWPISTPYELDLDRGSPVTLGENNLYEATVDPSYGFGFGFKGFIESRRGYSTTAPLAPFPPPPANAFVGGNPELDYRYPTRFAGIFAPSTAAITPSVQRFMRTLDQSASQQPAALPSNLPMGVPRRTHDMSLLRPHPDFDIRTMDTTQQSNVASAGDTSFALEPEDVQVQGVTIPATQPATNNVESIAMPMVNTGLFERPQAELHMNRRNQDRDAFFRYKNAARLAGVSTSHSNVFLVRLTLGYFVVDPETGGLGREFVSNTGTPQRSRATYVIDRTIPTGFLPGKIMNAEETILYAEVEE